MADFDKIKKELLEVVNQKHPELISKVQVEIETLEITEGLYDKNNLEVFYNLWLKKKDSNPGSKNSINSWLAFSLGLTTVQPTGDFLPARRAFARAGFPDIDTDFDDDNRDTVINYLIEKYGRDNVGNIGTHGKLNFKSCITRIVKTCDIADSFHKGKDAYITDNVIKVNEILAPFPKEGLVKIRDEHGESHLIKNIKDAYEHCRDFKYYMDKYPEVMKYGKDIEGGFGNFGSHASGIIISDVPLGEIAPLRTARGGNLATQFVGDELEAIGLIKFDILAIATLTVVKRALKSIKENYDINIDMKNLSVDDSKTFELFRSGSLAGVFQCDSWGMKQTMKEIGVDCFDDIMAGLALYRPGPMDSIPEYCSRKRGDSKVDYLHPSIEKYVKKHLEKTYGIMIYQEQIMQICNSLAGFSVTEGYVMIKAIGKKKQFLMDKFEKQFIQGCLINKVPVEISKIYWDKFIVPFASYGFNKSHSACYAYNAYLTGYLKANYPDEFACAFLSVALERGKHDKMSSFEKQFIKDCDLVMLPRDVNKCKISYVIERKKDLSTGVRKSEIRPSILCKGMSSKAAENIVINQPYKDLRDFAEKTNSDVDSKSVDALVEAGYFGKKVAKNKELFVQEFAKIRSDIKKLALKGIESVDLFA